MNVHIVSNGRTTEHVKKGLRALGAVDKVYLLPSETFAEVAAELESVWRRSGTKSHRATPDRVSDAPRAHRKWVRNAYD